MSGAAAPLSRSRLFAFGLPQFPHSMALLPVVNFIPAFYSDQLGLPLAMVGLMLFLTRLTDIVTDPIIGAWSDRAQTRFGRRKPFIVLGLPLLMASTWYVFVPGETATLTQLFWGLFFMYLGFTIVDLPYGAWGAELSNDYDERTRVAGWKSAFGAAGTMAALAIPAGLAATGQADTRTALLGMALAFVIGQPLAFAYALWRVPEPPPERLRTQATKIRGLAGLKPVLRNGPFLRLVGGFVLIVGGLCIGATLNLIFCTHVIGAPQAFPYIIFAENVASLLGLPVFAWIAKTYGKHRAAVLAGGIYALSFLLCFLYGPGDAWAFGVTRALAGSALLGITVVGAALTADVVDKDLLDTGEERTGLFFALFGMASKTAVAVGVLVGTSLPALGGFQPSDPEHSAQALTALRLAYCLAPPLLMVPGLLLLWNHPLTREAHRNLREQIDALKA